MNTPAPSLRLAHTCLDPGRTVMIAVGSKMHVYVTGIIIGT